MDNADFRVPFATETVLWLSGVLSRHLYLTDFVMIASSVTGRRRMWEHQRNHKTSTCPHCNTTMIKSCLKRHKQSCKAKEENLDETWYSCDQCDYKTNRNDNLKRHMKAHSKSKIYCEECGHQCLSEKKLEKHKEKAHRLQKVMIEYWYDIDMILI